MDPAPERFDIRPSTALGAPPARHSDAEGFESPPLAERIVRVPEPAADDLIIRLGLIALVAVVVAVYAPALGAPFVWDDITSIVHNESIRALSLRTLTGGTGTAEARPVLNLSLALNYAAGGANVVGYHVVNVEIHLLATLLLFGVVRRTLLIGGNSGSGSMALAITALWALHPLQTESVTFTVQRAESLMGMFYLMTLYCFIRGVTDGPKWYLGAVAACSLGMATKEAMVTAPVLVLLFDVIYLKGARKRWAAHLSLFATWAILIPLVSTRNGTAGFGLGMSVWDYAKYQPWVICRYVRLSLFPADLVFGNGWRALQVAVSPLRLGIAAVALGSALVATAWWTWRRPKIGFLGIAFFLILAPTSSVLPIVTEIGAEHRMYLALAPLATLAVLGIRAVAARLPTSSAQRQIVAICICSTLVGALACRTAFRNLQYGTPGRLSLRTPAGPAATRRGSFVGATTIREHLVDFTTRRCESR